MAAMVLRRLLRGWELRMPRETRSQSVALAAFSLLRTHLEVVSAALVWIGGNSGKDSSELNVYTPLISKTLHSHNFQEIETSGESRVDLGACRRNCGLGFGCLTAFHLIDQETRSLVHSG